MMIKIVITRSDFINYSNYCILKFSLLELGGLYAAMIVSYFDRTNSRIQLTLLSTVTEW